MTGGLGSATSHDSGFFSSSFTAFSPRIQYAPFRQKDAKHPLPLPLGEVDERSEDGEGKPGCNALSVAYGDSSPKGRAKGLFLSFHLRREVGIGLSLYCQQAYR